jgi:hypothetical protein
MEVDCSTLVNFSPISGSFGLFLPKAKMLSTRPHLGSTVCIPAGSFALNDSIVRIVGTKADQALVQFKLTLILGGYRSGIGMLFMPAGPVGPVPTKTGGETIVARIQR